MNKHPFTTVAALTAAALLLLLLLAGCNPAVTPTATAVPDRPTITLTPTEILVAIPTPATTETATMPPTPSPEPEATVTPTSTEPPSVTPIPSPTPTATAPITPEVTFELVYHSGGFPEAIDAVGNLLYLGVGRRLRIMDVSNLEQPVVVGQSALLNYFVQDVVVQDNVAYVANGSAGLHVFDVSNPADPRELEAGTPFLEEVYRVNVQQNILYALGHSPGAGYFLWLLNIEVSGQPEVVAALPLEMTGEDIQIDGDYAYIPCQSSNANSCRGQVYVVYVGSPAEPELVREISPGGSYSAVALQENKLYVLNDNSGADLLAYNVTDPVAPQLLNHQTNVERFGLVKESAVAGNYLFSTTYYGEFDLCTTVVTVVNLAAQGSGEVVASFPLDRCGGQIAVSGERVYVLHDNNISAFSASAAEGVELLATWTTNDIDTTLTNIVVTEDGYGFATFFNTNTIHPLDLRDPALPTFIGLPFLLEWYEYHPYEIATANGYLYASIAHASDYFYAMDVSNLDNVQVAGELMSGILAARYDITLHSHYAYLTGANPNILVIDVQNPAEMTAVGEVATGNCCLESATVVGNFLYIAGSYSDKSGGFFHVLDVAEPAVPQLRSTVELTGSVHVVTVAGEIAYLGSARCPTEICTSTLTMYTVSDPTKPVEIGRVEFPGEVFGLAVVGDYVLVAAGNAGVFAMNVAAPARPYLAGHISLLGLSKRIVMVGELAYIIAPRGGLYVLRLVTEG